MTSLSQRIAELSPEKRALLALQMKGLSAEQAKKKSIPRRLQTGPAPLSFAQQRLWFLDQFEPGSPYYNIPVAVQLTGRLDRAALERSLHELVRRHETLRTTFASINDQPVQVIAPELTIPLVQIDLGELPAAEREAAARRQLTAAAQEPFDLVTGPLLRTTLLHLSADTHILLLTLHHIIADGWSMGVLIGELSMLYAAFVRGESSPLPSLAIQYADFAIWQRERLSPEAPGAELERQLAYWKRQLADSPPVLALPTDRPRPAVQSSRGALYTCRLPRRLLDGLKQLSQQEGATLFMTLLAAWQSLLHRYSGQADICVGSPIANRTHGEIEALIGCFVNTLVLRADLRDDPSFRALVQRVKSLALEAYANQDVPFELLVETLQPTRSLSRTPLFQVMFILQNAGAQTHQLPGLTLSQIELHSGTSTFDLTLSMAEQPNGLDASLEYNTDLFDAATIARLMTHFERLLEGATADPDRRISRLPLLDSGEQQQILVAWNQTQTAYPQDVCLHQLFAQQALRTPHAEAVICGSERLTYAELDRRSEHLACYLQDRGIVPETLVGICVERSPEMIVAVLGVLKAGAAYVPLDPSAPPDRLGFMLRDAAVPLLLTQQRLAASLPDLPARTEVLCLDADWSQIAVDDNRRAINRSQPWNLAYVIYTSGSTGRPKGVQVQHGSLVNAAIAWHAAYDLRPGDRHLQMASFAFDVFGGDLVRALTSGGTLVLCPRETLLDPPQLHALIQQERITCAEFVPVVLRALISYVEAGRQQLDTFRLLICGSDVWYVREYQQFRRSCAPATRVINSFGLTEATIDSTYFEGAAEATAADQLVPIGRPFANNQIYILDRFMQPVPVGVAGELYVGGAGLARGYRNRPDLTAAAFVPHPWAVAAGERLYRTGDLARYLASGNIEFLGRADYQVKVRGYRIELGEIEAVLEQIDGVAAAVVIAREEPSARGGAPDVRLVAYVVRDPKSQEQHAAGLASAELRAFLADRLPEYMVPSAFVVLEALPLTPNGKVDRTALPAPDWTQGADEDRYVAPRSAIETTLAGLYADILGLERVGIHDNFFALGGHSLLATQLVSRVRTTFAIDLPLRTIFEAVTVALLAERVVAAQAGNDRREVPPILPAPRDRELPLSFAQQRLWFLDQLEPGSSSYNVPDPVRLIGPLDVAALERSINAVIRRHEVLRTTFAAQDGRPYQVIAPELRVALPVVDLQHLPEAEREAAAVRQATEDARQPFDLRRGPLIRARVIRLAADDHVLLLTLHHIITDGWSQVVFIRELVDLYQADRAGGAAGLSAPLPIQYADYAVWQRQWLDGPVLEAQIDYWKQQLLNLTTLDLPTDRPRPAVQSFAGATHTFVLPAALATQLRTLSQQEDATLFMTLVAAWQTLLHRYSAQDDIVIGTPIAGRTRAETEQLIGFFVNTLVLRTDLTGNPAFREALRRVREVTLGAYAHQDVPFERLVDELQPVRDLSRNPLFQVGFGFQTASLAVWESTDLTLRPLDVAGVTAKQDLMLFLRDGESELYGSFEYSTDLFDAATIERLAQQFAVLLESIVADPDCRLSDLPLLTAADRRQLLVDWTATRAAYPQGGLHELFAAQAARTPEAIAVVFVDGQARRQELTYGELDRRANQLAHHLQRLGVGPDVIVGLCLDRSLDLIVALLGVLKAGGAYVPLDPNYPQDRLAFMLADAQPLVLLTQQRLSPLLSGINQSPARHSSPVTICLDTAWAAIAQEPPTPPSSDWGPNNLAYVIYTSGSTGRPKGTLVTHRGLSNLCAVLPPTFAVDASSRVLQFASFSFDAAVTDVIVALLTGAALYLAPQETLAAADDLCALLRNEAITTVTLPPALLAVLPSDNLPALQTVISAGDRCTPELAARWRVTEHGQERRFVNGYGPTEATVALSFHTSGQVAERSLSVPIGRPIANTYAYLLDRNLHLTPPGVPGEICIGGEGLARGYLNRPDLTAEKFIPDPFSQTSGARLYRTGDLARWLPDGSLDFLGRIDQQVKIRGFRIELGEIEAALAQHPAVGDVVVVVREDAVAGSLPVKRLVAYVVANQEPKTQHQEEHGSELPALGAAELRRFLQDRLPDYMIPGIVVVLDALPLTPNGKVDRKALPAPDHVTDEQAAAFVAPGSATEATLARIWSEVLGRPSVGVRDNFFALGGDSILSIQIVARANQAGLRLLPKQLFQHQTIAELAAAVGTAPLVQAEQGIVTGPVPLTPIQRWFFEQEQPDIHHFNQAVLLEARQPIDFAKLEQVIAALVRHHDALRLRVTQTSAGWEQINAAPDDQPLCMRVDLADLPVEHHRGLIETIAAETQASLSLETGPLLRVVLFDTGATASRLLIVIHHLAVDGVSWRILLDDLQTAYGQLAQSAPIVLPPKTTSFRQWAERLTAYAQSAELRAELDDWQSWIAPAAALLPLDYPHGANTEALEATVTVALSAAETRSLLEDVPPVYHTRIDEVLLTALSQSLLPWTGGRALLVDLEGHGREDLFPDLDVSRTVGWFTTVYPVAVELEPSADPGHALKTVKEQLRRIPQHGIGYGLLRYLSAAPATDGLRMLPAPEISFNYLGQFDQVLAADSPFGPASESSGPARSGRSRRLHVIDITASVADSQLHITWSYSSGLHRHDTIASLAQSCLSALRSLISHCQSPEAGGYTPSDFPLAQLSQDDLDQAFAEIFFEE